MKCQEFRNSIIEYLDDPLALKDRFEFDRHLRGCDACRDEVRLHRFAWEALDQLPAEEMSSADLGGLADRVMEAAGQPGAVHRSGRVRRPLVAAAAAVVVLAVVLVPRFSWFSSAEKTVPGTDAAQGGNAVAENDGRSAENAAAPGESKTSLGGEQEAWEVLREMQGMPDLDVILDLRDLEIMGDALDLREEDIFCLEALPDV